MTLVVVVDHHDGRAHRAALIKQRRLLDDANRLDRAPGGRSRHHRRSSARQDFDQAATATTSAQKRRRRRVITSKAAALRVAAVAGRRRASEWASGRMDDVVRLLLVRLLNGAACHGTAAHIWRRAKKVDARRAYRKRRSSCTRLTTTIVDTTVARQSDVDTSNKFDRYTTSIKNRHFWSTVADWLDARVRES